ncbi:MAG TPA: TMEM165/GDT1 family protein [Thermoflexia bacterium]|nr:TMEM165/GDT1 family protein [Thermoflexia bacterium]
MDLSSLFSTFGLVFLAELGDKTQLAVVAQTCRCRQPWAVFAGASIALAAATALGVVGGHLLGYVVPASLLRMGAAFGFGVMGLLMAREAWRSEAGGSSMVCPDDPEDPASRWDWEAFFSTFGLLFVAELGDKTQLTVLALSGRGSSPWSVFCGGVLALVAITALGVVGGERLTRVVPERVLLGVSAVAFVGMGVLMGIGYL